MPCVADIVAVELGELLISVTVEITFSSVLNEMLFPSDNGVQSLALVNCPCVLGSLSVFCLHECAGQE